MNELKPCPFCGASEYDIAVTAKVWRSNILNSMDAYYQFIFPIVTGGASLAKSADMRRTTSQNQNLQSKHGTTVPERRKHD